jgi:hypothetical protein
MTEMEPYSALEPTSDQALIEAIRADFAPAAPEQVIAYFLRVAAHRDLDPWRSEIALVPRANRRTGEVTWHYEVMIAGRRAIASRSGRLAGIGPPQWCGPRQYDDQGRKLPLEWEPIWDSETDPPYCARVEVYVHGWSVPSVGVAKWSEFAVYLDPERNRLNPFWRARPAHQLAKVAESLALRRAFPEVAAAVADEKHPLGTVPTAPPETPAITPPPGPRRSGSDPPDDDHNPPVELYNSLPEALGRQPDDPHRYANNPDQP